MDDVNQRRIIAQNLQARRRELGLSRREVGAAIGLPTVSSAKNWVRRRESGESGIDAEDLFMLCDTLDIADPRLLTHPGAFDDHTGII